MARVLAGPRGRAVIGVTVAILRSFVADRASVLLSIIAPIAFFSLVGAFYGHLESPGGMRIQLIVDDASESDDGRLLAQAIERRATEPITVVRGDSAGVGTNRPSAVVTIPQGFSRDEARVDVLTEIPLPGASGMIAQLLELAAVDAFGTPTATIEIAATRSPNRLIREASVGICIVFMMFALSSLAAKGLANEAAGLGQRLASLGIGPWSMSCSRIAAMTVIGLAQLGITLAWASLFFGAVPRSATMLLLAAAASAFAVAGFMECVAVGCGTRSRFAAIVPVVSLVLAAGSGAMIPRFVMPERLAELGSWLFPSWSIDACRSAMDGHGDWTAIAALCATGLVAAMTSAWISSRRGLA